MGDPALVTSIEKVRHDRYTQEQARELEAMARKEDWPGLAGRLHGLEKSLDAVARALCSGMGNSEAG